MMNVNYRTGKWSVFCQYLIMELEKKYATMIYWIFCERIDNHLHESRESFVD